MDESEIPISFDKRGRPYRDLLYGKPVPPGIEELRRIFDGENPEELDDQQ